VVKPDNYLGVSVESTIRLEINSAIEMVELIRLVSDHVARSAGFDPHVVRQVVLAIRECVGNAITHGNRGDPGKRVFVELTTSVVEAHVELAVSVRDQGSGFDPGKLHDSLAPDRILPMGGRGIFLMRQLMDDVSLEKGPDGGMEVKMVKRLLRSSS
jgi:serine/threonine-protein kinase RsbW